MPACVTPNSQYLMQSVGQTNPLHLKQKVKHIKMKWYICTYVKKQTKQQKVTPYKDHSLWGREALYLLTDKGCNVHVISRTPRR